MKFAILSVLVLLAVDVSAVQIRCADLTIEIEESTLKTTMTENTSGNVMVSYPTLKRRLTNRVRQTFVDTYLLPVNQTITKMGSTYVYTQTNNSGQVVVPETRCQVDRN